MLETKSLNKRKKNFHNSEKSAKFATLFKFDKKLTNTFK